MRGKRLDIQGLRALAVVLVIANHLTGWPGGGFIGVDVFFVISGFLITGHLVVERERTGRISLADFYRRRIRRILPASITVVLVTIVVGFSVFGRDRFSALVTDGIWATLFSANWRFIFVGTDYMHANDAVSPLQHYWSLSIEEQFYFIWPVLLLLAIWIGSRRPRRSAAIAITLIGVVSFGYALWESAAHPTSAYFSTFSRAWELAAGALLAIAANRVGKMPLAIRPYLAWTGLLTIALSAAFVTAASAFPAPFALGPILGTVAVIAAGIGTAQQRFLWPLTNPVSRYLGDISYSLYLWHFPVIAFATVFFGGTPRRLILVVLVVTAALSIASYHWIETPTRTGRKPAHFVRPVLAVASIAALSLLAVNVAPQTTAVAATVAPRTYPSTALGALYQDVDDAVVARTWPALEPKREELDRSDKAPEWVQDGCLGNETKALPDPIENALRCSYGNADADKVAVVFGDSVAISWVPGVRAALEPLGYRIDVLTVQQCPTADVITDYADGTPMTDCPGFRDWALDYMSTLKPDLVIASNVFNGVARLTDGATGAAAGEEWQSGSRRTLSALVAVSDNVVLLQSPPSRSRDDACGRQDSSPADCYLTRSADYTLTDEMDEAASRGLAVRYVRTESWFCADNGECPSFTGTAPVLVDGAHLTADYSRRLAPVLAEVLARP